MEIYTVLWVVELRAMLGLETTVPHPEILECFGMIFSSTLLMLLSFQGVQPHTVRLRSTPKGLPKRMGEYYRISW